MEDPKKATRYKNKRRYVLRDLRDNIHQLTCVVIDILNDPGCNIEKRRKEMLLNSTKYIYDETHLYKPEEE